MLCDMARMALLRHFLRRFCNDGRELLKGRKKELWDKAEAERQKAEIWLAAYIRDGQQKPLRRRRPTSNERASLCALGSAHL